MEQLIKPISLVLCNIKISIGDYRPDVEDDSPVEPDDGEETEQAARDHEVAGVEPHGAVLLQRLRKTRPQAPGFPVKDLSCPCGGKSSWPEGQALQSGQVRVISYRPPCVGVFIIAKSGTALAL